MLSHIQYKNKIPYILFQKHFETSSVVLPLNSLFFSFTCLKKHILYRFEILTCISGVDLLNSSLRFCVVYELLSITYNIRLRVKVFVNEVKSIASVTKIYINANWWEREIWDLFGIYFENHPDLRRLLTDYGFEGYPLRKDFPLYGYLELRYDEKKKRVIVEPLELSQDFRFFTFENPWS